MKNFFKKIAFVLALAMVLVSVAPATANAATKAPSLKKTSKILYIGGDLTGTISDTYRFTFNDAAGYTATWKSKNTKVVKIEGKNVVAVGVGKAEVVATLTNKAGKSLQKTATVWVKQNAEEVGFGSTKAIDTPIELGAKVKINVYRLVGDKKIWTQTDMATCTDVIKWSSSDEKVATVDKWGTVTAVGAGEATITATATQPQGPTAGESASYKVTVVSGLTEATQKSLTSINAKFGTPITADQLKTVKVYQLVGNTKVLQTIKKATLSDDKLSAVIEIYTEMPKNTTYVVSYDGKDQEFVSVDATVDTVTKVTVEATTAVKNDPTDVKAKVYVNNVDVTSKLGANVEVSTESTGAYLDKGAKKITLFTTGTTAVVKAVFHTYKYENNAEKTLTAEGLITCVDKSDVNFKETTKWSFHAVGTAFDFDTTTVSTTLAAEDQKLLAVKIKLSDGATTTYADTNKNLTDFTFESSNNTVLLVNGNTVTGVAGGTAVIVVKYKNSVVDAFTITVGSKRDVANIEVKANKGALSSYTTANDKIVVSIDIKDQLGDGISSIALPVASIVTPTDVKFADKTATKISAGHYEVEFLTSDFVGKPDATYQFKVAIKYNNGTDAFRYVTFSVNDVSEDASVNSHKLVLSQNTVDMAFEPTAAFSYKNTSKDIKFSLEEYASNGYKVGDRALTFSSHDDAATAAKNAKDTPVYYYVVEAPNGVSLDKTNKFNTTVNTFNPVVTTSTSGIITKADKGTYKVTAYKAICAKDNNPTNQVVVVGLDASFFTLSDNQVGGSIELVSNTINATVSGDLATAIIARMVSKEFVKIKFNGADVTSNLSNLNYAGSIYNGKGEVFVYSVTYDAPITLANGNKINGLSQIKVPVTIVVNQLIKFQ